MQSTLPKRIIKTFRKIFRSRFAQNPLNSEQRLVFDTIIKAVADSKGLFFLDAPGDVAKLLQLKELSIT